jgi:hypothetical protein
MDSSELSESAKARGLPIVAALVSQPAVQAHLAAPAAPDELLDPPRSKNLPAILEMLARRGLDPDGMTWLLPQLDPLERALVAWDVLTGALLKPDSELDPFRGFAAESAVIVGTQGRRGCGNDAAREAVSHFSDSSASTSELLQGATAGRLASLVELRARGPELAARARAELDVVRARARLFARAHFPTLASLQLGILWHAFDDREALLDWIDVLADAGRFDALPPLDRLDDAARAYVEYRSALAAGDPVAAISAARALASAEGLRAAAVRVDAGTRTKRRDEVAERALAGAADSDCRFAARVDMIARIVAGEEPQPAIDRYLGRFGNDIGLWGDLAAQAERVADLPAACESIIARELQWLPHDPAVWCALALMLGEPASTSVLTELDGRLAAQSSSS